MPKGISQAEAMSNSEKIKPVALAVIKLHLSEGISQSVTQSVENSVKYFFFKFRNNLLKAFRIDLKACLSLVYLTNTASSSRKIEAGFWAMLFCGPRLLLCGPYYTVLSYCMIL